MLFEDKKLAPYTGDAPFVFLSYSHKDAEEAAEIILALKQRGFRIWYDEGLAPGTEWDENVAEHIEKCSHLFALISGNYLNSKNCLDELKYANDRGKALLLIYLEDVELTGALAMRFSRTLAVHKEVYKDKTAFYDKVSRSEGIDLCIDNGTPPPPPEPEVPVKPAKPRWMLFAALAAAACALFFILKSCLPITPSQPALTPIVTDEPAPTSAPLARGANRLMSDPYNTTGEKDKAMAADAFLTGLRREEIETITFLNSLEEKPKAAFDLSAGADGSVWGWTVKNDNGLYDLYIAGEGGISAPVDCSGLFNGYVNLKSIDFGGNFHTEDTTNFLQMFFYCPCLNSLDLSGFDTSNVTNMAAMFCWSSGLRRIELGDRFDTSNVTDMTSMFYDCENLLNVDIGDFNTENVEKMHGMFYCCSKLKTLNVSGFVTANVKYMGFMFSGCSGLTELDVSGFDTSKVTDMSYMFYNCDSLTELDVSGFDTSKVTDMSYMFGKCSSLTELNVSRFDTSSAGNTYAMFYNCSSLTELDVSRFDTSKVTDMSYMFYNCDSLTELDVSGFDTSNVTACDYFMPDRLNKNWRDMFPAAG